MQEVARAHRVSYRRRLVVVVAAAAALLVATGFGTYALTRDEPEHVDSIGCYSEAGFDADVAVIGNTAQDPVAACAELWRAGSMAPGTVAPPLEACVLATGAVAVFPASSPGVCNALGVARLSDAARAEFRRLGGLQAALLQRLGTGSGTAPARRPCPDGAEARRIARDVLDERGFRAWTVETSGVLDGRDCPSPTLERARRVVVLHGIR
jgi:hypothetical protein